MTPKYRLALSHHAAVTTDGTALPTEGSQVPLADLRGLYRPSPTALLIGGQAEMFVGSSQLPFPLCAHTVPSSNSCTPSLNAPPSEILPYPSKNKLSALTCTRQSEVISMSVLICNNSMPPV